MLYQWAGLDEGAVQWFAGALQQNTTLRALDLFNNKIDAEGASLSEMLKSNRTIRSTGRRRGLG